jgi:hypothetical protein
MKLPGAAAQYERRPGLHAVGAAAARVVRPIVARRGDGVLGRLKADWRAIASDELAAAAWPEALGRAGVLKLRVAPHAALELQHRTPLLIERINLFFGRGVVERIALVQGPLPLAAAPSPVVRPDSLSAAAATALEVRLAGVTDPALRKALCGLGRLVLGRRDG